MKKILATTFLFGSILAVAQVDRTKAPEPAPAKAIHIGEYQSFTLKNGLQVFVVENHKLPRVQFSLSLRNNPPLEGDKVGSTEMAGTLMGTGTKNRTKAQIDEAVDFIGATFGTGSDGIFAGSLTKHIDKLLDIMSDVLLNPIFPQDELDKLKTQTISDLQASKESPGFIAGNVRGVLDYGKKHPYGEIETEETVSAVSVEDCRKYYSTYFKPNNAYLAIVGDVDLKKAKSLCEKYFASWAKGDVQNPAYSKPTAPEKTFVALVDRPTSVQSVINITYPLDLYPGSQDAIHASVLNQILGGGFSSRLMQNLREDKGFTYSASSSFQSDELIGSFNASASVRNEVTDSAVYEVIQELKRITETPVTDEELQAAKAYIEGSFGRSLENPQTVARFAINTARYGLPKDYYANYVKNIDAVTKDEVLASAKKLILPDHAYVLVVGKASAIQEKLSAFGELKFYSINGEQVEASAKASLPSGLTAETVIGKYLEAIGGSANVAKVKALRMQFTAEAMGMELTMDVTREAPNKSYTEISSGGRLFQKAIVNGDQVVVEAMGQRPPIEDPMKELQAFNSLMFKENGYKAFGAKPQLIGIEKVDDKDAYVVEFVLPHGEKTTEYYDRASGLRLQSVQVIKTSGGEVPVTIKYGDYSETQGVKYPHSVRQQQGQMNLAFELTDLAVNPEVDDSIFVAE